MEHLQPYECLRKPFSKTSLKTQEKLEELEIMYLNGIYIRIS